MKWSLWWAIPRPLDLDGGFESWTHRVRVVDEETVKVDFLREPSGLEVVLKRYTFPRWEHRLRGCTRHTLLGMPKALREFRALQRLRQLDVPAAEPLGAGVLRGTSGFVRDSWLVTMRAPGLDLEEHIAGGRRGSPATWRLIGQSVRRMHAAGVWYRGLVPRNVMVEEEGAQPRVCWVDPARAVFARGALEGSLAARDLLRLWEPLHPLVGDEERGAFEIGYGEEGASDPEHLWERVPPWSRRPLERVVEREIARLDTRRSGNWPT